MNLTRDVDASDLETAEQLARKLVETQLKSGQLGPELAAKGLFKINVLDSEALPGDAPPTHEPRL